MHHDTIIIDYYTGSYIVMISSKQYHESIMYIDVMQLHIATKNMPRESLFTSA